MRKQSVLIIKVLLISLILLAFIPSFAYGDYGDSYTVYGLIKYSNNLPAPNGITVTFTNLNNGRTTTETTKTSANNISGLYYLDDIYIIGGTNAGDTVRIDVSYGGNTGNATFTVGTAGGERIDITLYGNLPPNQPSKPSGSETVYRGQSYSFSASTTDDEGDQIRYMFDWGDGAFSDWTTLTTSGTSASQSHAWASLGVHQIQVKAKDEHGAEVGWSQPEGITGWSQPLNVTVLNVLPTASFAYNYTVTNSHTIYFTDESTDSDGSIATWNWDFGDGNISTDQNATHQYQLKGTCNVTLNVTDDDGAANVTNSTITIVNSIPVANFTYSPANPTDLDIIQFSDASTDSDGSVVNWSWDFGDGNISYDRNPTHQYANNETYTITLTVKDNENATSNISREINVANAPPIADFTYLPSNPTTSTVIKFTDSSADTDGSITSRYWDFGDNSNSTNQNPTHIYSNHGTYQVNLTVTDNDGATNTTTSTITVTRRPSYSGRPSNIAPTADFVHSPSNPTTSTIIEFIDNSTDPDGDIVSWLWDFRDGTTTTGESPTHIYSNKGIYDVTLIVTDNKGATDAKTVNVTVSGLIDIYIDSLDISFSNETPLINETVTVYAAIHNLGESNVTAIINFYDGNPSFNTSKFIGSSNISVSPNETDAAATVEWIATTVGAHNIYVVISNCQPSETNEENNVTFNTLTVAEKTITETPANSVVYVFIAVIISTTILFYFKKRTNKK